MFFLNTFTDNVRAYPIKSRWSSLTRRFNDASKIWDTYWNCQLGIDQSIELSWMVYQTPAQNPREYNQA